MSFKALLEREKTAILYGQSVRFRIIKYAILIPLFAGMWWSLGWYIALQILGALFILALIVHFFYRYKTAGWTKEWGGFKPLLAMMPYWNEDEHELLSRAQSYSELLAIAERVIARMPKPVAQVCGPITTGGLGSFAKNIAALKSAIELRRQAGDSVFDQTPFQEQMESIKATHGNGDAYDHELLLEFYQPLFEKRMIDELYFIPGWETSVGSRWEHTEAERLGLPIHYL